MGKLSEWWPCEMSQQAANQHCGGPSLASRGRQGSPWFRRFREVCLSDLNAVGEILQQLHCSTNNVCPNMALSKIDSALAKSRHMPSLTTKTVCTTPLSILPVSRTFCSLPLPQPTGFGIMPLAITCWSSFFGSGKQYLGPSDWVAS